MNAFLIRLWYVMKSGCYMTTGNDELSGWTEKKLRNISQSQTCTNKRVLVTVRWSAAGLIHYSFLNPGKTITSEKYAQQIDEIHWKLQCLHLALVKRKDPALLHDSAWPVWPHRSHNQCFESWANWATNFCLICHIANWLPLLQSSWQLFAEKMLPQPAGGRKCFPRVCQILKHGFLCYRNKQIISHWHNVLIIMVPILINKELFELIMI